MKVNITIPDKWYDREGEKNLAYHLIDLENDALRCQYSQACDCKQNMERGEVIFQ